MGFNLFLTIDLNLLTLGILSLNFSVAYTKHRCPKKITITITIISLLLLLLLLLLLMVLGPNGVQFGL